MRTVNLRLLLLCSLASLISGCPESESCDEGEGRPILADGTLGDCQPLPGFDGGMIRTDGGEDAGQDPCADCDDAHCIGDRCVVCTVATQTEDCPNDGFRFCDEGTHECVQCLEHADCSEPLASACNPSTHECGRCMNDSECVGVDGRPICDIAMGCVQCAPMEEGACGTNVCDVTNRVCTTTGERTGDPCTPCVSDRQCKAGMVCAPMEFMTSENFVGFFCLWRQEATELGGPMGSCSNIPPYSAVDEVATISGETQVEVCSFTRSTCEAQADYPGQACGTIPDDTVCGVVGLDDGVCRPRTGSGNRCTVLCLGDEDCPSGSCNTVASPRYCNF
jgi:hypothetical protein